MIKVRCFVVAAETLEMEFQRDFTIFVLISFAALCHGVIEERGECFFQNNEICVCSSPARVINFKRRLVSALLSNCF